MSFQIATAIARCLLVDSSLPRPRERTESEYRALLSGAGFNLQEVVATASLNLLVAKPASRGLKCRYTGPIPTASVASVLSSDWGVRNDKAVRVRPGAARSSTHGRDGLGPDVWLARN